MPKNVLKEVGLQERPSGEVFFRLLWDYLGKHPLATAKECAAGTNTDLSMVYSYLGLMTNRGILGRIKQKEQGTGNLLFHYSHARKDYVSIKPDRAKRKAKALNGASSQLTLELVRPGVSSPPPEESEARKITIIRPIDLPVEESIKKWSLGYSMEVYKALHKLFGVKEP